MTDGTEQHNPTQSIDSQHVLRQVLVFHAFMGLICALTFFVLIFFSFDFTLKVFIQTFLGLASSYHFIVASYIATRFLRFADVRGEE